MGKLSKSWYYKIDSTGDMPQDMQNKEIIYVFDTKEDAINNQPYYEFDRRLYAFMNESTFNVELMEGVWAYDTTKQTPEEIRQKLNAEGMFELGTKEFKNHKEQLYFIIGNLGFYDDDPNMTNIIIYDDKSGAEEEVEELTDPDTEYPELDYQYIEHDQKLYDFMHKLTGTPEEMEGVWSLDISRLTEDQARQALTKSGMIEIVSKYQKNSNAAHGFSGTVKNKPKVKTEPSYEDYEMFELKKMIQKAINIENYEEAAKIRDAIQKKEKK